MEIDVEHIHDLYAQNGLHMQSLVGASAIKNFPKCKKNTSTTDGPMSCNFTSLLTVFQTYQDDGMLIMEGCMQQISTFSQN